MAKSRNSFFTKLTDGGEWWVLGVVALIAFFLGCLSFFEYATGSGWLDFFKLSVPHGYAVRLSSAYYALQMLFLNPPYLDKPTPVLLQWGRWLAAGVFCYTIFKIIFQIFRQDIRIMGLWRRNNHVIVCGLGQLGLPLALKAHQLGERPVAIEKDPEAEGVAEAHRHGIPVVIGNADDDATLRLAGVGRARQVLAVCTEDQINIAIVNLASQIEMRSPYAPNLECWLFIGNPILRATLQRHDLFSRPQEARSWVNVRGLDVSKVRARQAFTDLSLKHISLPADSGKRPKLILVGFGEMGHSLAYQAALMAHFPSGGRLEIMVVDDKAAERVEAFKKRFPNLKHPEDKVANIVAIPGTLEDPEIRKQVVELYSTAGQAGELLSCALCHEDDDVRNVAEALDLVQELQKTKKSEVPLLVYQTTKCGLAPLLAAGDQPSIYQRLRPFGMIENIWTFETLKDEKQDELAQAFHQVYCDGLAERRHAGEKIDPRPAEKPWEQLDETYREANRALADHLRIKLHAVGMAMKPVAQCGPQTIAAFDNEQIQLLAKMEHARWRAERYLAGWTSPSEGNDDKKQHPDLVPWEQLSFKERVIDEVMMSKISLVLSQLKVKQGVVYTTGKKN